MSAFFRRTTVWVVDFRWDGHPRRWFKALPVGTDAQAAVAAELQSLYGGRARLESLRPASADEERDYLQGRTPVNLLCPTGRRAPTPEAAAAGDAALSAAPSGSRRRGARTRR